MLRVCSTRPEHGAAKYSSRWRAVFHRTCRPARRRGRPARRAPSRGAAALGPLGERGLDLDRSAVAVTSVLYPNSRPARDFRGRHHPYRFRRAAAPSLGDELARQFEDHSLGRVIGLFLESQGSAHAAHPRLRARASRARRRPPSRRRLPAGRAIPSRYRPRARSGGQAPPIRFSDLGEPERIAAVRSADDQHPVALGGDALYGGLPVRSRVANVLAAGSADPREASLKRSDNGCSVVHGQRGF